MLLIGHTGRRTLETYLLLLLSASPELKPSDDLEVIVARTLNSYVLGEHVGRQWGIGGIMRWVPAVPKFGAVEGPSASLGLWKVQGDTVSAVVGGVFRQFVRLEISLLAVSLSDWGRVHRRHIVYSIRDYCLIC